MDVLSDLIFQYQDKVAAVAVEVASVVVAEAAVVDLVEIAVASEAAVEVALVVVAEAAVVDLAIAEVVVDLAIAEVVVDLTQPREDLFKLMLELRLPSEQVIY